MANKKYTIQETEAALDIIREAIPGITIPQINYGTAIGGVAAPEAGATKGATWGTNLSAIPDIVASLVLGILGAWNVTNFNLRSGNSDASSAVLLDPTNSQIRLGATTGDYITLDGVLKQIVSSNYQAGTSGFKISPDLIEAENVVARGTLRGVTFINDVISAVGGQLMVANASSLAEDMTAADDSTLTIKSDTTFSVDDFIIMRGVTENGIEEEWLRITDASSAPEYEVIRDLAGLFAPGANPAWKAGTPVVKQGAWSSTTGNKYTAPLLIGNDGVSSPETFFDLALGDNDGAIKLNINGTDYDNIDVNLTTPAITLDDKIFNDYDDPNYIDPVKGQSFTALSNFYVKAISFYIYGESGFNLVGKLRLGEDINGTLLATSSAISFNSGWNTVTFPTPILLTASQQYCLMIDDGSDTGFAVGLSTAYSGGKAYTGGAWSNGYDMAIKISGFTETEYYEYLAEQMQSAIRTATSSTEVVSYDTDHFVITGVTPDYYITCSAPSTGTDLTGAGATLYFDIAGGTSTNGGYGSGGWLRLFGEGTNSPYYSVFKRLSGLYNDYVETCRLGNLNGFLDYNTDEYGIAMGDSEGFMSYDITNGLRIRGTSFSSSDGSPGISTTITTASLVGKTITVKDGLITGFA